MKALLFTLFALPVLAQTPAGLWDATVVVDGHEVPFRMEFSGDGERLTGSIVDGDRKVTSTSGMFSSGALQLRWDYYDAILLARLEGDKLAGGYTRRTRKGVVTRPFTAVKSKPETASTDAANFAGDWILTANTGKASGVMSARFRQSADDVTGTIQRIDGDFGTLSGTVRGKKLNLSHFDGIRATWVEATLKDDGTLEGVIDGSAKFTGARAERAAELKLPEPPDPSKYTYFKDPSQPLSFRFQDVNGNWVSTEDPKFRNKPLIVTIFGTWCPNCHDEAPVLVDLYRRFHEKGLEVIALAFEYTGQVERDRDQIRAFLRLYNVPYTILLAGTTDDGEVQRKLPQLVNFGAFPTTFYLGRDHRVRSVHAGFSGPATGDAYEKLKAETTELVEKLVEEK